MNPFLFPTDQSINLTQKNQITDLLLDMSYQDLVQKYDKKEFFRLVADLHVDNEIILLREMMIANFTPDKVTGNIPVEKKDELINILATNGTAPDLLTKLQQIDSNLTLPQNFNAANYQLRASEIANAMQSIKMAIAEEGYTNFLDDTSRFLHYPPEKLKEFSQETEAVSEELAKEYTNLINNTPPNPAVINKAADLTGKLGRIPIFVESLKEKKNLGEVSEVIQKLSASLKIATALKAKNLQNPDRETIIAEIKKYLVENTFL